MQINEKMHYYALSCIIMQINRFASNLLLQSSRLDANKMIKMCIFMQIKIEIMHYNANRFFHLFDVRITSIYSF